MRVRAVHMATGAAPLPVVPPAACENFVAVTQGNTSYSLDRRHAAPHQRRFRVWWMAPARTVAGLSGAVCLLVVFLPVAEAQVFGDPACPCIDAANANYTVNGEPLDVNSSCPLKYQSHCYPITYGGGRCQQHDKDATPVCAADAAPAWCAYSWCYVDPKNCERPFRGSRFFPEVRLANGEPLSFSYETCGNLNYFSHGDEELRHLGRKLRVSIPPRDSPTLYCHMTVADGEEGVKDSAGTDTRKTGSIIYFMKDLFDYYGIEWEFTPVSAESLNTSFDWATQCGHDVALNRTDMCWTDSWLVEVRLNMTTFIPLWFDDMKVMTRKKVKTLAFSQMLAVPFRPFTPALWAVIISQYFICFLIVYLLEGQSNEDDFPDQSLRGGVTESLYKGFAAAYGSGLLVSPQTTPGKIVCTGLSLSLMVFMSIYGAQVTTALVESRLTSTEGSMKSFEEGYSRGAIFCVYFFPAPYIKQQWPKMNMVEVSHGSKPEELFDALHQGKCEASLLIPAFWTAAQAGLYYKKDQDLFDNVYSKHLADTREDGWKQYHCDDKIFPLPSRSTIWSIGNGIYVREELARLFEVAIFKAQNDPVRSYSFYEQKYIDELTPPDIGCKKEEVISGEEGEEVAATVTDGVGATMVSTIFTVGGIIFWLMTRMLQSASKELGPTDGAPDDDETKKHKTHPEIQEIESKFAASFQDFERRLMAKIESKTHSTVTSADFAFPRSSTTIATPTALPPGMSANQVVYFSNDSSQWWRAGAPVPTTDRGRA